MMNEQKRAMKLAGGAPKLIGVEPWKLLAPMFAHAK